IDAAAGKFNFPLVAYNIGTVAAQLGEQVNNSFAKNPGVSQYSTGLLLYRLQAAFDGIPDARESGLLHAPATNPGFGPARDYLKQLDDQIKPIAKMAVDLINSPKGQVADRQKDLSNAVASLKQFLDKNPPAETHLVPGGKEDFPVNGDKVAKA